MRKRIHSGSRRHKRRKRLRYLRVKHCISRYQTEIIYRIFVPSLRINNDRRDRSLTPRASRCRDGDKKRKPRMNLKDAFHFPKRLVRMNALCSYCLRTVNRRTSAKSDKCLASIVTEQTVCFLNIISRRVSHRPVKYSKLYPCTFKRLFKIRRYTELSDHRIRHQKH